MPHGILQINEFGDKRKLSTSDKYAEVFYNSSTSSWIVEKKLAIGERGRCNFVPLLSQTLKLPYYSGRKTTITVGTNPYGVSFDGTHVWVGNNNSNNVSKININTNTVVAT